MNDYQTNSTHDAERLRRLINAKEQEIRWLSENRRREDEKDRHAKTVRRVNALLRLKQEYYDRFGSWKRSAFGAPMTDTGATPPPPPLFGVMEQQLSRNDVLIGHVEQPQLQKEGDGDGDGDGDGNDKDRRINALRLAIYAREREIRSLRARGNEEKRLLRAAASLLMLKEELRESTGEWHKSRVPASIHSSTTVVPAARQRLAGEQHTFLRANVWQENGPVVDTKTPFDRNPALSYFAVFEPTVVDASNQRAVESLLGELRRNLGLSIRRDSVAARASGISKAFLLTDQQERVRQCGPRNEGKHATPKNDVSPALITAAQKSWYNSTDDGDNPLPQFPIMNDLREAAAAGEEEEAPPPPCCPTIDNIPAHTCDVDGGSSNDGSGWGDSDGDIKARKESLLSLQERRNSMRKQLCDATASSSSVIGTTPCGNCGSTDVRVAALRALGDHSRKTQAMWKLKELNVARECKGDCGASCVVVLLESLRVSTVRRGRRFMEPQRVLHVANLGGCGAVLCQHRRAVVLSERHTVGNNAAELMRVEANGGVVVSDRVLDQVPWTRCFGHPNVKRIRPGVLTAVPHVCSVVLDPPPAGNAMVMTSAFPFVVIGSSALFETLDSQTIVTATFEHLAANGGDGGGDDLARHLVDICRDRGCHAGIAVCVVLL